MSLWAIARPRLFSGNSESLLRSRSSTPVTPPSLVARQVTEPTPATKDWDQAATEEVSSSPEEPEYEDAMDSQSTVPLHLEGDMIVPLNVERPKTYADMTDLSLKFPDFAEQILALPLPPSTPFKKVTSSVSATPTKATPANTLSPAPNWAKKAKEARAAKQRDPLDLPRKTQKTCNVDRATRPRGGRQNTHSSRSLPHKSPSRSPTSVKDTNVSNPNTPRTPLLSMQTPPSGPRNVHPYFSPNIPPSPTPGVVNRPTNSDVDTLIAMLQKARTADPGLQGKTLLEIELELKLSRQGQQQSSPHFPISPAPLGVQSASHVDFASWGKKPNGEMGYVQHKPFTPPKTQGFNAFANNGRKRSAPMQNETPTPPRPGLNGGSPSVRSSPKDLPGPRHFSNRNTRMSLPTSRPSPEPSVRSPWPMSTEQAMGNAMPSKEGMRRFGPTLDELTRTGATATD